MNQQIVREISRRSFAADIVEFSGNMGDLLYFRNPRNWQLSFGMFFSVANMDHEEIVRAILDDLLNIHFETSMSQGIHWINLMRFIDDEATRERVLVGLLDYRVQALIEDNNQIIRVRPSRDVLQAAMNIVGAWWPGFEAPEGTEVMRLTPLGESMIEQLGVDGAAEMVLAEMLAPPTSQVPN